MSVGHPDEDLASCFGRDGVSGLNIFLGHCSAADIVSTGDIDITGELLDRARTGFGSERRRGKRHP